MGKGKVIRYFIRRQGRQSGPFTKEELRAQRIEEETQVWNEEAFAWQEAHTFDELKEVLSQPPPAMVRRPFRWLRFGRKGRS